MTQIHEAMVKRAFNAAFRRRYHTDYCPMDTVDDLRAIRALGKQAEERGWDVHKATSFFTVAISIIEKDPYWKDKVGLIAAHRKLNDVYVHMRHEIEQKKAGNTFDPDVFRTEGLHEPNLELCQREMALIREGI